MDFDTCVTRIWGLRIYFVKKTSCKNPSLRNCRRFGYFAPKSRDCHMWSIREFGTHCYFVDSLICLKTANFNDLFMTQVLNPLLGGVKYYVTMPPPPPSIPAYLQWGGRGRRGLNNIGQISSKFWAIQWKRWSLEGLGKTKWRPWLHPGSHFSRLWHHWRFWRICRHWRFLAL